MSNLPYEGLIIRFDVFEFSNGIENVDNKEEVFKNRMDDFLKKEDALETEEYKICVLRSRCGEVFEFNHLAEEFFTERNKLAYIMTTPAIERVKTYISFMNEDEKNGCNIRERYLFRKIYQAAIDIRYTDDEKRKIFDMFVANALSQEEIKLKALDLFVAYKIAKFNGYELSDVPIVKLDKTYDLLGEIREFPSDLIEQVKQENIRHYERMLSFMEGSKPDKEALDIFNIRISKFNEDRDFFKMKG